MCISNYSYLKIGSVKLVSGTHNEFPDLTDINSDIPKYTKVYTKHE